MPNQAIKKLKNLVMDQHDGIVTDIGVAVLGLRAPYGVSAIVTFL